MNTFILSRIQFAANISFHILFPTISIALCWFLLFFKIKHTKTQDQKWFDLYMFWVKIFALTFTLGVISGVTMSFQFGTNWPKFMEVAGNIAGPILGYEVMTAFFIEAIFLGVMLFGYKKVPEWFHTLATFVVAFGTTLSAFWIISLNSWMQTPAGYEIKDGIMHATNWFEIIFNPSMPYRFAHVIAASFLTSAFLIAGVSSFKILKNPNSETGKTGLKAAITVAAIVAPLQLFIGDNHGLNTLEHQPQKVAAMEGLWETKKNVPLLLFALPSDKEQKNNFEIGIPSLTSMILTHKWDGELKGLKDFEHRPSAAPVFFSFRVMVGSGMLMIALALYSFFQLRRKKTLQEWNLRALVGTTFIGWVATIAGWYVTEIGRQPYIISGVLKTKDAVTTVPSENVGFTLAAYLIIYAVLLFLYIQTIFVIAKKQAQQAI